MSRVLTHNAFGYARGCRCDVCREGIALQRREERARRRAAPCDVCCRVHNGTCKPDEDRTVRVCVSLPGWLHREMVERVPWGERSAWLADLAAKELAR